MSKYRNLLASMMDEGTLEPRDVADACLRFMTEADCEEMAWNEWNIEATDDAEDENDDDDEPIDCPHGCGQELGLTDITCPNCGKDV